MLVLKPESGGWFQVGTIPYPVRWTLLYIDLDMRGLKPVVQKQREPVRDVGMCKNRTVKRIA